MSRIEETSLQRTLTIASEAQNQLKTYQF